MSKTLTTLGAAVLAALAVAAPASAAARCGTIRATIDGVPSVTRVAVSGASCARARKVAHAAIRGSFPGTVRVDGQRWRGGAPSSTPSTFKITYKRLNASVRLRTRYTH